MKNKLTLLVTLKDRANLTERLCQYFSLTEYPFTVLFADGSLGDENENYFNTLKDQKFSYEYIRYPKDETLHDYYTKCHSVMSHVKTPYVVLADNDDFPMAHGQTESINFLNKNPDYVGCIGRTAGIKIYEKPFSILFFPYYCTSMDTPPMCFEDIKPDDRVISFMKTWKSVFYCVFRTDDVSNTFNKILEMSPTDLGPYEMLFSTQMLLQGKVKNDVSYLSYLRQKGTSQAGASRKHWIYRMFTSDWLEEIKKISKYLEYELYQKENDEILKVVIDKIYELTVMKPDIKICNYRINLNKYFVYDLVVEKMYRIFNKLSLGRLLSYGSQLIFFKTFSKLNKKIIKREIYSVTKVLKEI